MNQKVDDVGFVSDLIEDLAKNFPIDRKRVFATGISNGGMLSYRLACELSDKIAAIAPVAATGGITECKLKRPVPTLHFHGKKDSCIPRRPYSK